MHISSKKGRYCATNSLFSLFLLHFESKMQQLSSLKFYLTKAGNFDSLSLSLPRRTLHNCIRAESKCQHWWATKGRSHKLIYEFCSRRAPELHRRQLLGRRSERHGRNLGDVSVGRNLQRHRIRRPGEWFEARFCNGGS